MQKKSLLLGFLIGCVISVTVWYAAVFAEQSEDLSIECQIDHAEASCKVLSTTDCRKLLEKCDNFYQQESARIDTEITKTQQEKNTLKNKIASLTAKIKKLSYQISQSTLVINDLGLQIQDTTQSIQKTADNIEKSKTELSGILRSQYQEDRKPFLEVLVAQKHLSGFFNNLADLEILNNRSREMLQNIKILKGNLEAQKQSLDEEKGGLEQVVKIQTLQKIENAQTKQQHEQYLQLTEQEYQKQLKDKQETEKKAAAIRARIFELIGVEKPPTFGEAYEIAKYVENATGIRPAFLLAVLTQESNIGKQVGGCYLQNPDTGAGIRISSGKIEARTMHPQRDAPPFLNITQSLGRDPYKTPISCPMSFGWGGAMGPAQFIPSTWMLYHDRLKSITAREPNPWKIQDAFLAAGLYLTDAGAGAKTSGSEWSAALKYFSGSTSPRYSFYGDSVMSIARQYTGDIASLEKTN